MLKTCEMMMFPKLNMTGDTKAMRNGIITAKPLLRYTITKETTETSTRLKHKAEALFVHKDEERQSKHNQKPEKRSSQEFDHREAQMVICCV